VRLFDVRECAMFARDPSSGKELGVRDGILSALTFCEIGISDWRLSPDGVPLNG